MTVITVIDNGRLITRNTVIRNTCCRVERGAEDQVQEAARSGRRKRQCRRRHRISASRRNHWQ